MERVDQRRGPLEVVMDEGGECREQAAQYRPPLLARTETLVDRNNEIVADSAEGDDSKSNARRAVENVRGECGGAEIDEE